MGPIRILFLWDPIFICQIGPAEILQWMPPGSSGNWFPNTRFSI